MFPMPYSRKSIALDEIELLRIDKIYNSQNLLLSNDSLNCDDTLSLVYASQAGSSRNIFNLQNNKLNAKPEYNSIKSSANSSIGTACVENSRNVTFGTIFGEAVVIENSIAERNDVQHNLNIQHDPSETRSEVPSDRGSKRWLFLCILLGVMMLIVTIITAGCYVSYLVVAGNLPPNADTTATSIDYKYQNSASETTLKTNQYNPTDATSFNADHEFIKTHQYPPIATPFNDVDYEFVERENYNALPAAAVSELLSLPIRRVIIAHTVTPYCTENKTCAARVRQIQEFHKSKGYSDISYNFVIGGDGRAYEGRGYTIGSHTKNYNNGSICIAFIGDFTSYESPEKQLGAAQRLINDGIKLSKIHPDYILYGHRQLENTASPGTMLYNQIMSWPHWSKEIIPL